MRRGALVLLGVLAAAALAQAPPPPRPDLDPAFDAYRQITDRALLEVLNRRQEPLGPPTERELARRRREVAGGALVVSQDRRPVYVGAVRAADGRRWVFRRANPPRDDRPPAEWYALGDVLEGPRQNIRRVPLVRAGSDPEALAEPEGWHRLGHFGVGDQAVGIWEPVASRGYRALGVIALPAGQRPDQAHLPPIATVRRDLTWPRIRFQYPLVRSPSDPELWMRRVVFMARAGTGRHDAVWWLKD